jgi:hypothetical protein
MEVIMRIRRTILAPVIMAIGTTGALAVGPTLALTATATPASAAAAASTRPGLTVTHGDLTVMHADFTIMHG